uniref:Short stop (inferred by orthology to a D. melanogaster protein) n=1 Tax=Strongyloides venezuelensis TaxID=75913 RepID=A0A0K0FB12_STRVS
MSMTLSFIFLFFKAALGFLFVIKYIQYIVIIIDRTSGELNRALIRIKYEKEDNHDRIKEINNNKEEVCDTKDLKSYVDGESNFSNSKFTDDSRLYSSSSIAYSNFIRRRSNIPKYDTPSLRDGKSTAHYSPFDNRPPFNKYTTPTDLNLNVDYSNDLKKIENQIQNQIKECSCSPKFKVKKLSDNNNVIFYEFGSYNTLKRHVRIYNSTVSIRVGGGWVSLDDFFNKIDPCRVGRKRYSQYNNISPILRRETMRSYSSESLLTSCTSLRSYNTPETPLRRPRNNNYTRIKNY